MINMKPITQGGFIHRIPPCILPPGLMQLYFKKEANSRKIGWFVPASKLPAISMFVLFLRGEELAIKESLACWCEALTVLRLGTVFFFFSPQQDGLQGTTGRADTLQPPHLTAKLLHCYYRLDRERSAHLACESEGLHAVHQLTG